MTTNLKIPGAIIPRNVFTQPSEALPQTDEACRVTPTIAEDYLRSSTHTNVTVKYSLAWQAVFLGYV